MFKKYVTIYTYSMKQKAFGFIAIFLVIFQLFSPFIINFSDNKISVRANTVSAQTPKVEKREYVDAKNADAFLIVTGITDGTNIKVSAFTDPNHRINSIDKIEYEIRDGFVPGDIETGCSASNVTLVSNPSLTSPDKTSIASLNLANTEARGYLKQDFTFSIPSTFFKKCIEDNGGFDEWGHYKFTYTTEDRQGVKTIRTEKTSDKNAVEELADTVIGTTIYKNIKDHVVFIKAQKGTGNSFDVEWGQFREKDYSSFDVTQNMVGTLKVEGKTNKNILHLSADIPKQKKGSFKVNYFQDNSDRTLYTLSRSELIQTTDPEPKTDGSYQLSTEWSSAKAQMAFDPNANSGTQVTWTLLNTSTKQNIQYKFANANYVMEDYSIKKLEPAMSGSQPVLDIDIAMLIDKPDSTDFIAWNDVDNNRKASPGDIPGGDWDNFTKGFNNPEIDTRTANEGGYGFYLLYSTSNTDPKVGGNDVKEINLNPYIFGEKVDSPIISDAKTGMVFGLEPLQVEKNKTYYFRLFANEHDPWFDDNGYTPVVSVSIPDQITQTSRGGAVLISSGNSAGSGPAWMPKCDAKDIGTWFTGCLVVGFYYMVFVPTAFLLGVAGSIMDFVLAYSIQPDSYNAQYIKDGWRFIRDVCNLFFIFMLLYLAFKLVLNIGQGTKQLIVNTLIVATVINFSFPLTTIVIDISNITARQLYYNVFSRTDGADGKAISLSSTAAEGYDPQKIILDGLDDNAATFKVDENKGTVFMILLMGVIFNVIAMLIFLKIALQFIYRIIGLIFAIILSPLAVFSLSLSSGQRSGLKMVGFEEWMQGLLKDAFKAPIFLVLMMILVLFVKNNPFKAVFGDGVVGIEWWMSLIIPFMLIIGFLYLIKSMTEGLTSSIAKLAGDKLVAVASGVAGFGAAIATGGAAWAGRNALGKRASRYMQSTAGEKLMTKAAEGNTWARLKVGALDMTRKGSFDLRQNKAASAVSGFTGVNMQAGTNYIPFFGKQFQTATTAGGYMAQMQRKTERIKKFEDSLGFDQEMYNKMEDVKKKTERAANNQEDIVNDLKERADEKFSEMRSYQQVARDHAAEISTKTRKVNEQENLIKEKQKEIDAETDTAKKVLLEGQKAKLEEDKNALKEEIRKHEDGQTDANKEATKLGNAEKEIRKEIKIEKDKLNALKGDGYTYVDEKTGKAMHVIGIKGAEEAMEKVKTDRADRYKQFQREKSGKIFQRKTGLDVYKEKIGKDLEEAETDEKMAKRSDIMEIMNEVENKAKTDKEWAGADEDKKKEIIKKYKKDTEILNKHAKNRIYEAVYNSIDIDSMEGEAKDKALKDVAEAARDIENMTYQLKSSPSGTRSKLGAVLNDSFLHTDVAKGSVLGAPFGWVAAPTAIATGLVRMAEYDRKFYENYGRSWQDKDTKVDTTDKYQPPKA